MKMLHIFRFSGAFHFRPSTQIHLSMNYNIKKTHSDLGAIISFGCQLANRNPKQAEESSLAPGIAAREGRANKVLPEGITMQHSCWKE